MRNDDTTSNTMSMKESYYRRDSERGPGPEAAVGVGPHAARGQPGEAVCGAGVRRGQGVPMLLALLIQT